jgi:hypothetical protein
LTTQKQKSYVVIAVLITTIFITSQVILSKNGISVYGLNPGTTVSGPLAGNTTWTISNSPYIIENTIQIPDQFTLTILPGVSVFTELTTGAMFEINGFLDAKGTEDEHITFDGNGVTYIFKTNHPISTGFLSLDYCNIKNAESAFWFDNTASLNLTNSDLTELSQPSHLWYPANDVYIEHNTFINSSGIRIGTDNFYTNPVGNVTIRYNLISDNQGFFVNNFASYGLSKVIINNNTFSNINGVVLEVEKGSTTADMDATLNYWGTSDNTTIESMIYDMNDDPDCYSYITYFPILDAPDPEVPTAPIPTPTPEPTSTASPPPSPTPSPTAEPSPTVPPPTTSSPTPSSSASTTPVPSITPNPTSLPTDSASPQPTQNSDPIANPDPSSTPTAPELTTPIVIVFLVSILVGITVAKIKGNKTPTLLN